MKSLHGLVLLVLGVMIAGCLPVRGDHRPEVDGKVVGTDGKAVPHARVFACTSFGRNTLEEDCDEEAFSDSGDDGSFSFHATRGESHWVFMYGDPLSATTLVVACAGERVGATRVEGNKQISIEVALADGLPEKIVTVGKRRYMGSNVSDEGMRVTVARLCARPGG